MQRYAILAGLTVVTLIALPAPPAGANHEDQVHDTQWGNALYAPSDGVPIVLPPEVRWNPESARPPSEPILEWRVGRGNTEVFQPMIDAIVGWNDALRTSPNSLTKYPFHYHASYDYNSQSGSWPADTSVRVYSVPDPVVLQYWCGVRPAGQRRLGCVRDSNDTADGTNLLERPFWVLVSRTSESGAALDQVALLQHELGHVLFFNEHYANPSGCDNNWKSIMDAYSCDNNFRVSAPHDPGDFFDGYKPADTPGVGTMSITSATEVKHHWDSSYSVRHNVSRYLSAWYSDTDGTFLGWGDANAVSERGIPVVNSRTFSLEPDSRLCVRTYSLSDAGYVSPNNHGPPTFFGCLRKWSGPQTSAGPFVAISHRGYTSHVEIRNYSGASRDIWVLGPNLSDVGCTRKAVANDETYTCEAGVNLLQYANFEIYIWNTQGTLVASAALDFE